MPRKTREQIPEPEIEANEPEAEEETEQGFKHNH